MAKDHSRLDDLVGEAQRLLQQGRFQDAQAVCESARSDGFQHPALFKIEAVAVFQLGDALQAARLLETAVNRYPDDPEAHFNLGIVFQSRGLMDEALAQFNRSAELAPGSAPAHYNKATALHETGQLGGAEAAYRDAIAADHAYAPAHAGLAFVLRTTGQYEASVAAYEDALKNDPDDPQTKSGYGTALQQLGRLSDAAAALESAAALDPDYPDACTNLADVLIEKGEPDAAVAVCDRYLDRHPGDSGVLAAKAIALGECGASDAVDWLVDFDRFLYPERQERVSGYSDIQSFNTALAERILVHPTLVDAPASHATRFGKHTGELLGEETGPLAAFQRMIDDAVARYRQRLGNDPEHPFVANALDRWRFTAWSIVMRGAGGHQAPHIHPSAWLSGVYYPLVPDIVNESAAAQAGWIEFGQPSEEYHWSKQPPLRAVRPEPGLLVLFPSYVFHRTIPYDSEGTRISVAFDVLPVT